MRMEQAIVDFLADLELAGRATLTRKRHRIELGLLVRWLKSEALEWSTLTRKELQRYMRGRAGLSASARANMLCSFRVFFAWALDQELIARSPAVGFRTPRRPAALPRALTMEQVKQLVAYVQACEGRTAHRDAILVLTGLYAGLRACELAMLRWSAVDLVAGIINIQLSKMGKGRSVPLHPVLVAELAAWRLEQDSTASAPVFSLSSGPITSARVGKIMRKISARCQLRFTAHVLRHSFATWVLRKSRDLYAVSKALGHSQVRQTEIYVSADVEQLRHAVNQLPSSW